MLSQAQSQKEHGKRCKITASKDGIKNADDDQTENKEIEDKPAENVEIKNDEENPEAASTETGEPKENTDDSSKVDDKNYEIKIEDDVDDDVNSKSISIDPKTYCKLGHFHLLLEDYAKGKLKIFVGCSKKYDF